MSERRDTAPMGHSARSSTAESAAAQDNVIEIDSAREDATPNTGTARDQARCRKLPDTDFRVSDIYVGGKDSRDDVVEYVYHKRKHYAVHLRKNNVLVHYSDDYDTATQQIASMAELIPMRDRLEYMIAHQELPLCYQTQIAQALRYGLEGKVDIAEKTLEGAIDDVRERSARLRRFEYLKWTVPVAILCAFSFFSVGYLLAEVARHSNLGVLGIAVGSGALGALMFIAVGIRNRAVVIDDDRNTNIMDGALRLLIGMISAGAAYLILSCGVLAEIKASSIALTSSTMAWQAAAACSCC
jgi:hypothetical protein